MSFIKLTFEVDCCSDIMQYRPTKSRLYSSPVALLSVVKLEYMLN